VSILDGSAHRTSDATREALLAAMGFDGSTEERAAAGLRRLDPEPASLGLPPVSVLRGSKVRSLRSLALPIPEPWRGAPVVWRVEVRGEDGRVATSEGRTGRCGDRLRARLPHPPLSEGYHDLRVTLAGAAGEVTATPLVVVAPDGAPDPRAIVGARRVFGLVANLYSVRSRRNWGFGDLGDLGRLLDWCREIGGAFVGINPLHAIRNRGSEVSPYSPVSRLFFNPLYLEIEAIPEFGAAEREGISLAPEAARLEALRHADVLEYEAIASLKIGALRALHREFRRRHGHGSSARGRAYAAFRQRHEPGLDHFATFATLEEVLGPRSADGDDGAGSSWPTSFLDPSSEEVARFREEHDEAIDFHRWLQFELDRQMEKVSRKARAAGLPLGVYQDLPIGTRPDGFDPWGFPGLYLEGVSVGAPPDRFNPQGQVWGLAPLDPRRLAAERYRYWTLLLRAAFRHSGALRIDHVMGLRRQYFVPRGFRPDEGAYVRYPENDLLGILLLEAARHDALVVGEDLGTVPPGLRPKLARRRILSSRVFYFERGRGGRFRVASEYPELALATANTHDLPTLPGFCRGSDIEERRRLGLYTSDPEHEEARRDRERDMRAMQAVLARGRRKDAGSARAAQASDTDNDARGFVRDVHAFLARTPCRLVGASLDDLGGETQAINLPGVPAAMHRSWTRRMALSIEALRADPAVAAALAPLLARALPSPATSGDRGSPSRTGPSR